MAEDSTTLRARQQLFSEYRSQNARSNRRDAAQTSILERLEQRLNTSDKPSDFDSAFNRLGASNDRMSDVFKSRMGILEDRLNSINKNLTNDSRQSDKNAVKESKATQTGYNQLRFALKDEVTRIVNAIKQAAGFGSSPFSPRFSPGRTRVDVGGRLRDARGRFTTAEKLAAEAEGVAGTASTNRRGEKLARAARIGNRLLRGVGAAGAVAGGVVGIGEGTDIVRNHRGESLWGQNANEGGFLHSRGAGHLTSAVSGIASGASAGLMLGGGYGAIAGGVIGGLAGLTSSILTEYDGDWKAMLSDAKKSIIDGLKSLRDNAGPYATEALKWIKDKTEEYMGELWTWIKSQFPTWSDPSPFEGPGMGTNLTASKAADLALDFVRDAVKWMWGQIPSWGDIIKAVGDFDQATAKTNTDIGAKLAEWDKGINAYLLSKVPSWSDASTAIIAPAKATEQFLEQVAVRLGGWSADLIKYLWDQVPTFPQVSQFLRDADAQAAEGNQKIADAIGSLISASWKWMVSQLPSWQDVDKILGVTQTVDSITGLAGQISGVVSSAGQWIDSKIPSWDDIVKVIENSVNNPFGDFPNKIVGDITGAADWILNQIPSWDSIQNEVTQAAKAGLDKLLSFPKRIGDFIGDMADWLYKQLPGQGWLFGDKSAGATQPTISPPAATPQSGADTTPPANVQTPTAPPPEPTKQDLLQSGLNSLIDYKFNSNLLEKAERKANVDVVDTAAQGGASKISGLEKGSMDISPHLEDSPSQGKQQQDEVQISAKTLRIFGLTNLFADQIEKIELKLSDITQGSVSGGVTTPAVGSAENSGYVTNASYTPNSGGSYSPSYGGGGNTATSSVFSGNNVSGLGYDSGGTSTQVSGSQTNSSGRVTSTASNDIPAEARGLLDTIAGTESPGYNVMYGGNTFSDMSRHPNIAVPIQRGPNAGLTSSAAGRYQFLASTWYGKNGKGGVAQAIGATDFSPETQDKGAWYLAQRDYRARTNGRDLLTDLRSNDPSVKANIGAVLSKTWTSLPAGIESTTNNSRFNEALSRNTSKYQNDGDNTNPITAQNQPNTPRLTPDTSSFADITNTPNATSQTDSPTARQALPMPPDPTPANPPDFSSPPSDGNAVRNMNDNTPSTSPVARNGTGMDVAINDIPMFINDMGIIMINSGSMA